MLGVLWLAILFAWFAAFQPQVVISLDYFPEEVSHMVRGKFAAVENPASYKSGHSSDCDGIGTAIPARLIVGWELNPIFGPRNSAGYYAWITTEGRLRFWTGSNGTLGATRNDLARQI